MRLIIKSKINTDTLFYVFLGFIILIGFYYRLLFAYNISFINLHMGTGFYHDEYNYNEMAVNIVEKGFYGYMSDSEPNAYVTPGFPLFLALIYKIFGFSEKSMLYAKTIQAILSTISIFLVYLIGKRISGRSVGLVAALFVSLYPPLSFYSRFLLTETLYIFMFLLYFLVQLKTLESKSFKYDFLAGLLFAAAILVRPLIFVLLPLPYIFKYIKDKDKIVFAQFATFVLGFIVLMLPWWIRNYIAFNKFILLATQSNPFYYGIVKNIAELPQSDNEGIDGIKLILHYLKTQPVQTIKWYTIEKLNIIFGRQDYWVQSGYMYLASVMFLHYIIVICGGIGIAMSIYRRELLFISVFTVLNVCFQLLFIPVERYAVPIVPLLSVCGAYMFIFLFRQCRIEYHKNI